MRLCLCACFFDLHCNARKCNINIHRLDRLLCSLIYGVITTYWLRQVRGAVVPMYLQSNGKSFSTLNAPGGRGMCSSVDWTSTLPLVDSKTMERIKKMRHLPCGQKELTKVFVQAFSREISNLCSHYLGNYSSRSLWNNEQSATSFNGRSRNEQQSDQMEKENDSFFPSRTLSSPGKRRNIMAACLNRCVSKAQTAKK